MDTFATRLKELRKKAGLSQPQLAKEIGLTKQTVSLWERGVRRPSFETMGDLTDFFNVSLAYLLGQSDDDTPPEPPTSEDGARWAAQDDDEELTEMARRLCQLSKDMRRMVAAVLNEAVRIDREQGNLAPINDHKVRIRTTWLDEEIREYKRRKALEAANAETEETKGGA